ncbi:MAG: hypothetical protein ABIM40_06370 [Pseudomonadota bacterium]
MNFNIDHACPQCGAPVVLEETDRVLDCPYCRVKLCMTSKGPYRYCMVPKNAPKDIIYLPYWRLRGILYSAVPCKVDSQFLDASRLAASFPFAPHTLGLRTQALNLLFSSQGIPGRFVAPSIPFAVTLKGIEAGLSGLRLSLSDEALERAYIGETTSIIHAPYYVRDGRLMDAILNEPVGPMPEDAQDFDPGIFTPVTWEPGFLPAMCPDCGWGLSGDKDSVVFLCENCDSAWQPRGDKFTPVAVGTAATEEKEPVYLPFWRIRCEVEGIKLSSYADMIRLANMPKAIQAEWERQPFGFWIPAFKVHPNLFIRLSRQLTTFPITSGVEERVPRKVKTHPVNLPLSEAAQSLKLCVASFGKPKRTIFQKLPSIRITPKKGGLVYVPFRTHGAEYVQDELGIAISITALYHGQSL